MLALLLLFLATLVGIDAQGCTIEMAKNTTKLLIMDSSTEGERFIISLNETLPNCLATSVQRGFYTSISMSVKYTKSDNDSAIEEARFNLVCFKDNWERADADLKASYFYGERSNCSKCSNTTVNDHHCTR